MAAERRWRMVWLLALIHSACSARPTPPAETDSQTSAAADVGAADPAQADSGDSLAAALELHFTALPAVRIAGVWHGAGRDGSCAKASGAPAAVVCPAGAGIQARLIGSPPASGAPSRLQVHVEMAAPATPEAVAMEIALTLPKATAWISNGFQSWSQTGALAIGGEPSADETAAALATYGDGETLRDGRALSWWYTAVGGGGATLIAGVLRPERQKAWAQVWRDPVASDRLHLRLASGGTGAAVPAAAGSTVAGEEWFIAAAAEEQAALAAFAEELLTGPRQGRAVPPPLLGWNSWYQLWDTTDETAARANFGLAKSAMAPLNAPGGRWLVIDDAWQEAWGDWRPNSKFPSGLDGLAKDVRAEGWHFGVWMAPFLVSAKLELVQQHPDWFLAGVSYNHLKNGEMKILDVTHPAAAAHLTAVVQQLVAWGVELIKIDFLFAGLFEGKRFDGASTPLQSYRAALELLRQAAGKDVRLVAVGAPPVPTLEYVDGWRSGNDIAIENFGAAWAFLPNQLRSLAARIPFCLAIPCDVDPPILRDLPPDEVDFGTWLVALAGGGLFLSDDLRQLPAARLAAGLAPARVALALGGHVALPESMFPPNPPVTLASGFFDQLSGTTTQIVPAVWKTADGQRVLLNAGDVTATVAGVALPPHSARAQPRP